MSLLVKTTTFVPIVPFLACFTIKNIANSAFFDIDLTMFRSLYRFDPALFLSQNIPFLINNCVFSEFSYLNLLPFLAENASEQKNFDIFLSKFYSNFHSLIV
jgi:hypothetical protein